MLDAVHRGHAGYYNMAQVCDFWDVCYSRWTYFSDPTDLFDNFTRASVTIRDLRLRGDCDDFAVVIAAGVRGLGGSAMVRGEWIGTDGHVYTEVFVGSDAQSAAANLLYVFVRYGLTLGDLAVGEVGLHFVPDSGYWLNLDWSANHPGGPYWASADKLTESHYFPTPSILWATPITNVPDTAMAVAIVKAEFTATQAEKAATLTPSK
ncbi:MAG: hypothetical protein NT125_08010 [Candidatus Bipolaricaulota bacterium]|nr:hypothetical protein [Candidatus Bipolaricaulota bacterium]